MLPKCVRSKTNYRKVQCHGDRIVGIITWLNGCTITYPLKDPRFSDAQHSITIRGQQLVSSNRKIRAQTRDAYSSDLCLNQRIRYVHSFLLAKAWYTAQIIRPPEECVRQLYTEISWYLWRGESFKVPLSTPQRPKERGGWGLIFVAAKIRALNLYQQRIQGQKTGTLTAGWLRAWDLLKPSINHPIRDRIPASMEYLHLIAMDSAYIAPLGQT